MGSSEMVAAGAEISAGRGKTWVALSSAANWRGVVRIELLEPHPGPHAAGRIAELVTRERLQHVAIDPKSPSATLVRMLRQARVPLRLADAAGMAEASGLFSDLLKARRLEIAAPAGDQSLDEAIRQAQTRSLAGATAVERYGGNVEMAPLIAVQLALWAAIATDPTPEPFVIFGGDGRGGRVVQFPDGAAGIIHSDPGD